MRNKVSAALAVSLVVSSTVSAQAHDAAAIAAGLVGGLLGGLVTAGAAGAYPTYAVRYRVPRPRPLPRAAGCGLKGVTIPMGAPVQTIAIRNTDTPELNFLSAPTRVIRAEIVSRPCNATLIKTSQPLGFRYIPRAGFVGRDMYAVRGCNDHGGCSITAFVVDVSAPLAVSTTAPEVALLSREGNVKPALSAEHTAPATDDTRPHEGPAGNSALAAPQERPEDRKAHAEPLKVWELPRWIGVTHKVVDGVDYTTRLHILPPGPVRPDGTYDSNRIVVECETHDMRTGKGAIIRGKGSALARQGTLGGDAGPVGGVGILVPGDDPKHPDGFIEYYDNPKCASGVPDFGTDD